MIFNEMKGFIFCEKLLLKKTALIDKIELQRVANFCVSPVVWYTLFYYETIF